MVGRSDLPAQQSHIARADGPELRPFPRHIERNKGSGGDEFYFARGFEDVKLISVRHGAGEAVGVADAKHAADAKGAGDVGIDPYSALAIAVELGGGIAEGRVFEDELAMLPGSDFFDGGRVEGIGLVGGEAQALAWAQERDGIAGFNGKKIGGGQWFDGDAAFNEGDSERGVAGVLATHFKAGAQGNDLTGADENHERAALVLGDVEQGFASGQRDLASEIGVVDDQPGVRIEGDFSAVGELDRPLLGVAGGEGRVLEPKEGSRKNERERSGAGSHKAGAPPPLTRR